MGLTRLLLIGANISVVVFVVSSTLGVGLRFTVQQILAPLRNGRLVALSLVANFVLTPLAAIVLAKVLGLDEPLRIGLLLCSVAGGAPFLLKLTDLAKGDMPFAVAMMIVLMLVTVGYMPVVLPLVLDGISVDPLKIARSLVLMMLIPLAVGLVIRAWLPGLAAWLTTVVTPLSSISMILVVVLTSVGHINSLLSVLGTFGILAAFLFSLACVGIGWALGGPAADTRSVLALGTAQRNTAAAMVVAGQNFDDPTVIVMITVVMIVAFVALLPVSRVFARRSERQTVSLDAAVQP